MPKDVALERVRDLESLFTDLKTSQNQTKEFTETVDNIYEDNNFEKMDENLSKYTNIFAIKHET